MENNLFAIVSTDGKNIRKRTVTANILHEIINDFIDNNIHGIYIMKIPKKEISLEIQKYYRNKYNFFCRKYKSNKITRQEYEKAIKKLKEIKNQCTTVEEFKIQFNKYKKNTNNYTPI